MAVTLEQLRDVVANDAAIRRVQRLQPARRSRSFSATSEHRGMHEGREYNETISWSGPGARWVS
jgi:hypothetical protein